MNWFLRRSPAKEIRLHSEDLHCQMCAQTVREALQKVSEVKQVKVNLSRKTIIVAITDETEITVESLIKALEPTGYRAKPITAVN
ncbi:MAG TPA: heavy-metal-associated domain-containing protein [Xenococcaceae cyanobacterium]